jgi:hypothetical protein
MIGTPASNGLHGLGGSDLIRGSGGYDFLTGDNGDDAVHGGSGDDRVEGNAGSDLVKGGRGADLIRGGSGGDVLRGGTGADRIEAQDGFADLISCGVGSKDLVIFDPNLDRVAADCEAPRAVCPKNERANAYQYTYPRVCDGLCECKGCDRLRKLSANGHCENKYRRKCT